MARAHGRIASVIWTDDDFLALDSEPQRLYMFMLSQPDLSHAGLIPMRVRRWAKKSASLTPTKLNAALTTLDDEGFIVMDDDTEEVLIRTFVRNDGVYKQPKVMLRMREDAQQIESPRLRAAFRIELDRLPLHELNAIPTNRDGDGISTREAVERVVNTLRDDFGPVEIYPSEGVSDTPHVRAGALPLPPTPVPQPPSPTPATSPGSTSAVAEREIDGPSFADFWKTYPRKIGKGPAEAAWIKAGRKADPTEILAAAWEFANLSTGKDPKFIPMPATWLNQERWGDEPDAAYVEPSKASTTDQRVRDGLALAQRLAQDEDTYPQQRAIGHTA